MNEISDKNISKLLNVSSIDIQLFIRKEPSFYIILMGEVSLGLIGNSIFLLIVLRMKAVTPNMYIIMSSLSITDVIGVLAFAETIVRDHFIKYYNIQYEMCRIATFLSSTSVASNIYHVLIMSFDRFIAVRFPHR